MMSEQSDRPPMDESSLDSQIAVIGVSGRYPESPTLQMFWENLRQAKDCLVGVENDELDALGIPSRLYNQPGFIRRGTRLPDADCFDARFFGFTPREAEAMDPQCRIFLETCYSALEDAGYDPLATEVPVGVFAGSNPNDYASLMGVADPADSLSAFDQLIGGDKDFLATRVAHRLNLKGPAMTLQTACSTSLVAVHMAAQSLLNYECSMCLAGGVTVNFRQGVGYFYQDGMILSPEGKCRAFDENASGTTLGQGCGVVVLKRMVDAVADNDPIYAVIRASALNNDGSSKVSYTAPSEDGQAEVIALAHELADIEADSITYVETHGTGTKLGDPVEISALTRAFSAGTTRKQYCAIGSAKTNFGHTDAAAGITGFLKTVLSLHHREIVPSLHFENPNPVIAFDKTPFYVNTKLQQWKVEGVPRRAGVSAFGIGGTNAHVVLEEAPFRQPDAEDSASFHLLPLSAKSPDALNHSVQNLAKFIHENEGVNLGNVAHTFRFGRSKFNQRAVIAVDCQQVLSSSESAIPTFAEPLVQGVASAVAPKLVWLYSGQGSQYPGMGRDLYLSNTVYAEAMNRCVKLFQPLLELDLLSAILADSSDSATEQLQQTATTQPALFCIEYAMSCLLRSLGLVPTAVVGHSIGEFAACVEASILSLEDAVKLVAERGRLMQSMETGSMMAVSMSSTAIQDLLPETVELAAENAPGLCVVSGPSDAIEAFGKLLEQQDQKVQRIHTSHAFHSRMMANAAEKFEAVAAKVTFNTPTIPMVSNVTGTWITDEQAQDPAFWARQIVSPVLFGQSVTTSAELGACVYLEVGPGRTLTTLVKNNDSVDLQKSTADNTIRHPSISRNDMLVVLSAVGRCWCCGIDLDWSLQELGQSYRRISLPTYPFDRERHWRPALKHVLALPQYGEISDAVDPPLERLPVDQWLYAPSWSRAGRPKLRDRGEHPLRVALLPDSDAGKRLQAALRADGSLVTIFPADEYTHAVVGQHQEFGVNVSSDADLERAFDTLHESGSSIDHLIHAWLADSVAEVETLEELEAALSLGVHAAQACGRASARLAVDTGLRIDFLTSGAHVVLGDELVRPEAAMLAGPSKVIALEYPGTTCRTVDLPRSLSDWHDLDDLVDELNAEGNDQVVALRSGYRWLYGVSMQAPNVRTGGRKLRKDGCYLIVGGLGGVGLSISRYLVDNYNARLILTSRSGRPQRTEDEGSETNRRLDMLASIEKQGAGVLIVPADAADENSMRNAVIQAETEMGPIDGVIVAAGVADQAGAIHRRSREATTAAISSKVHGSLILGRLFEEKSLDFLILSSSIATMLYHNRFAQVGYVTGNSYAEAYALRATQRGLPVTTVAWDDWKDLGMSVRAASSFSDEFGSAVNLVDEIHSFTPADGVQVFEHALGMSEPLLYVSTTDLSRRMEKDVHEKSPFLQQAMNEEEMEDLSLDELGGTGNLLRKIWSELIGFENIADTDDFFELGGDSLQAARMADRLSRSLAVEIPLNTIFDHSELASLAAELDRIIAAGTKNSGYSAMEGEVPLAPAQLRFLARNNPDPDHFNISALLQSERLIDIDTLMEALRLVVDLHDALRLRLSDKAGVLTQHVLPTDEFWFKLEHVTLDRASGLLSEQLDEKCDEIQRGLDLYDGPVFRAVLFDDGAQWQRLLVVVHHMVSDRVSLFLFLDGLNEIYAQLQEGREPVLSSRTLSYKDWVNAQAEFVSNDGNLGKKWLDRNWSGLKSIPVTSGNDNRLNTNNSADAVKISVPNDLSAIILKHNYARVDELLLLALGDAVAGMSGSGVALIEALGYGRRILPDLDVSRTMGFFLTYNPLLIDYAPEANLTQRVDALRENLEIGWTFEACKNYHANPEIREEIKLLPKAEVLFNYVGRDIEAEQSAFFQPTTEAKGAETDHNGHRDHLIAVMAGVTAEQTIQLTVVYSTDFHSESMVQSLADDMVSALCTFCEDQINVA